MYLAQLFDPKDHDADTWDFFANGNCCVDEKGGLPFSAIGGDHPIEHENRARSLGEQRDWQLVKLHWNSTSL